MATGKFDHASPFLSRATQTDMLPHPLASLDDTTIHVLPSERHGRRGPHGAGYSGGESAILNRTSVKIIILPHIDHDPGIHITDDDIFLSILESLIY